MKSNSYNILFTRIECANNFMNGKWISFFKYGLSVLGKNILLPGVMLLAITVTFANKAEAQGSLSLDGQSYAEAATTTDIPIGGTAFAIEFWVKHDGKSDQNSYIFTKGASGDSDMYAFRFKGASDSEELPIVFSTRYGSDNVVSHSGIPARRWTHVAVAYDGNQLAMYINGELDATSGFSRDQDIQDKPLVIGANNGRNAQFFSGEIDNLRFWDINRTLIEIQADQFTKLTGTESGLLALYHFDSQSSGQVDDQAGSHTLSLVNNATIKSEGGADVIPPDIHAKAGNQKVHLNWEERLGNNDVNKAAEFEIYRSIGPGDHGRQQIATVSGSQTTYTDNSSDLENGAVYYYQIRTRLADGKRSDYSSFVTATPYDSLGGGSLKLSGAGYGTVTDRPSLEIQNQPQSDQEHTGFTIETWVKHDGQSDTDAIILTKGNSGNSSMYQLKFVGPDSRPGEPYRKEGPRIQFSVRYGSGVQSNSGIPRDRWMHIAAVYDGDQLAIYINGELDATDGFSRNMDGNQHPLRLGTHNSANQQFYSGRIDELRLWSDARTEEEIKTNYRNQLEGTEQGLMSYWQFNDTGSTIPEVSGDGVITGDPTPSKTYDMADNHSTVELTGDATIDYEGVHPVVPLVYAQADSNQVNLEWSKRKSDEAVEYKLYRSSDIDGSERNLLNTFTDTTTHSYVDNSVDTNTTYYYELSVVDSDGIESDYVHPAGATTTPYPEGYALTLDNSNSTDDYATVENRPSINLFGTQLTVEAWVKFNEDSDENATILTKGTGNNSSMYRFRLVGTGAERRVAFDLRYGSGITSNDTLTAGKWYHVAGTYDGARRNLYINGDLSNQGSFSRNLDGNSNPLRFGTHNSANEQFFSGQIDEVRLWWDARTQEEIRNHYQHELMGNEQGLKAYWRFNEHNNTGITSSAAGRPKTAVLANNAEIAVSHAFGGAPVSLDDSKERHVTLDEDFGNHVAAALDTVFSNNDQGGLDYTVHVPCEVVNASIENDTSLVLSSIENVFGSDTLTVKATDGSYTAMMYLIVQVESVNDIPELVGFDQALVLNENGQTTLDMWQRTGDVESHDTTMVYSFNTDTSGVITSFNEDTGELTVEGNSGFNGVAELHISVTDEDGASASDTVDVEVGETTAIEEGSGIPEEMALRQNYPNPFNPSTTLRFDLTESREVTLAIYNTLGRRVKTLIRGEQLSAGKHNVRFEAGNLPSGVYFYTIQAGDFNETNKMILMK